MHVRSMFSHLHRSLLIILVMVIATSSVGIFMELAYGPSLTASPRSDNPTPTASPRSNNPIRRENQLPGTTQWQLTHPASYVDDRSPAIEGYAWATSVAAGNALPCSVSTTAAAFRADVYRLGWYQGTGARLITTISNIAGKFYPMPPMDTSTGLVDPQWPVTFRVQSDTTWTSGVYLIKLTTSTGKQSYIPFTVTSPRASDFVFVHSDIIAQAYNGWGGKSLYAFNSSQQKRAYKVAFDRPVDRNEGTGDLFYWEYPMIRWMESNGFDVSYISDVDLQIHPSLLQQHKAILLVGHSEYWTTEMRDTLEATVSSGVNLGVFAADTMGWQIRYEPQPFGSHPLPDRVIVCYKEARLDPLYGKDNSHVTVEFSSSLLNRPEQSILGVTYNNYNTSEDFPWVVSDASHWLFAGTGLKNGDRIAHLVGYEYDAISSDFPIPQGEQSISSSPVNSLDGLRSTSNSTIYTAASGARVFDSGSMQWSWGLDNGHVPSNHPHPNYVNPKIQLITLNLFHNFLSGRPKGWRPSR